MAAKAGGKKGEGLTPLKRGTSITASPSSSKAYKPTTHSKFSVEPESLSS